MWHSLSGAKAYGMAGVAFRNRVSGPPRADWVGPWAQVERPQVGGAGWYGGAREASLMVSPGFPDFLHEERGGEITPWPSFSASSLSQQLLQNCFNCLWVSLIFDPDEALYVALPVII